MLGLRWVVNIKILTAEMILSYYLLRHLRLIFFLGRHIVSLKFGRDRETERNATLSPKNGIILHYRAITIGGSVGHILRFHYSWEAKPQDSVLKP